MADLLGRPSADALGQPSSGPNFYRGGVFVNRRKPQQLSLTTPPMHTASSIKAEFGGVGSGIAYGAPAALLGPPSATISVQTTDQNGLILKNIGERKLTRDGQQPKRRGPKPDSKPALTRRQELNRQAQRTHRERKEKYIKALEDEVLRLKEAFAEVTNQKKKLAQDNHSLRMLLQQGGLLTPGGIMMMDENMTSPSVGGHYMGSNSAGSVSGSNSYGLPSATTQNTAFTSPPPGSALSTTGAMQFGLSPSLSPGQQPSGVRRSPTSRMPGPSRDPSLDYEQLGTEFVLNLEKPCMNHMPWLVERGSGGGSGREPCGHALMATCPPEPFSDLSPDRPFGNSSKQQQQATANKNHSPTGNHNHSGSGGAPPSATFIAGSVRPTNNNSTTALATSPMEVDGSELPRTWELSKTDLATLLDLSQRLDLDGELTPVMAWGMVLAHPRLGELSERDFARLAADLTGKVRCYGFGAVLEEFEVRDAIEAVLSTKPEPPAFRSVQAY